MAGFDVFTDKLELLINSIEDIGLDAMDTAANDSIALLQRRLQEEGVDSEGNAWRPYSEQYKKYKEKQGKTGNGKVNFTLRDRMLNNIGIVATTKGQIITVRVRPRSEENQEKMFSLSYGQPAGVVKGYTRKSNKGNIQVKSYDRKETNGRGRIMSLSDKEATIVSNIYKKRFLQKVNEILQ